MDELQGLIASAGKLASDLKTKAKVYADGILANDKKATELVGRETALKEAELTLAEDQKRVAHVKDVVAERIQLVEDRRLFDAWADSTRAALAKLGNELSEKRKALDREAGDLALDRAALLKEQIQLGKDKDSYKTGVLKGLGIKV